MTVPSTDKYVQDILAGIHPLDNHLHEVLGFEVQTAGKRDVTFDHVFRNQNLVAPSALAKNDSFLFFSIRFSKSLNSQ